MKWQKIDLNNNNNNNNRSKDPYVTIRHINLAHKELTTAYILAIKHDPCLNGYY